MADWTGQLGIQVHDQEAFMTAVDSASGGGLCRLPDVAPGEFVEVTIKLRVYRDNRYQIEGMGATAPTGESEEDNRGRV